MPLIKSAKYLRIFRPKTIDGNIPKTINGEVDYHEFHVPANKTTRNLYASLNSKRPKHLRYIIEEVDNPNFKEKEKRAHQPESLRRQAHQPGANAVVAEVEQPKKRRVGRPEKEKPAVENKPEQKQADVFDQVISNLPDDLDDDFKFPDDLDKIKPIQ